jgi:uncharacterized protein YuzE
MTDARTPRVRFTYDESSNSAYFYFDNTAKPVRQLPLQEMLPEIIVFDFDRDNRLIGIEVLEASNVLPSRFLAEYANKWLEPAEIDLARLGKRPPGQL